MLKAPERARKELLEDDIFPTLSVSDCAWLCTTEGAALDPRDHLPGREGVLWASRPVEADKDRRDCPADWLEAVFDDIASLARLASDNRLTCWRTTHRCSRVITRSKRYG